MSRPVLRGLVAAIASSILPAVHSAQGVLSFSDQTAASGLVASYQPGGFQKSLELAPLAVGDFDNDGWQDLIVLSGYVSGVPDYLYMNNGDGTFTNENVAWGLTSIHDAKGVGVADYDGDGWLDIYMTVNNEGVLNTLGLHKLYRNNGDRTFSQVATAAGVDFTGTGTDREDGAAVTWGDFDLDGNLDLFVAGFQHPNLIDLGKNVLFRNKGDGTFNDITTTALLFPPNDFIAPFSTRFADMNGDFYPELVCIGDLDTTHYWVNNGDGTFSNGTGPGQLNMGTDEMGSAILDYDKDGLFDLFVTDVHWLQTNRLGNQLYRNLGNDVFDEVAIEAGVDDGDFGWGATAVDVNNDGWTDIVHTAGHYTAPEFLTDEASVFLNNQDGTFTEVAAATGLDHTAQGRGCVHFDYDNDGDQDIVMTAAFAPLQLYRNDLSGTDINYLRVFLGTTPNSGVAPNGFGAKVTAEFGSEETTLMIYGSDGHCSQSEISAHFGLGAATQVDTLTVYWPNGATTVLDDVPANQTLTIDPPSQTPAEVTSYNDSGNTNPVVMTTTDVPTLGSTWPVEVDTNPIGFVTLTYLIAVDAPLEFAIPRGVILIDITRPVAAAFSAGVDPDGVSRFALPVPDDLSLAGLDLYMQGITFGGAGGIRKLTNAFALTLGL